jgi:hypothetical protein
MLEDDIVTLLRTNAGLATTPIQLETDPNGKVFPKITLKRMQQPAHYTNDGPVGTATAWIQINCIAPLMPDARALSVLVKAAIHANMTATRGSTQFGGLFIENEGDAVEPTDAGRQNPNQIAVLSVRFNYYR